MIAVKAKFDGKQVILPPGFEPPAEQQDVFVLFEDPELAEDQERAMWRQASNASLRKVWDNPDDAIYDNL